MLKRNRDIPFQAFCINPSSDRKQKNSHPQVGVIKGNVIK